MRGTNELCRLHNIAPRRGDQRPCVNHYGECVGFFPSVRIIRKKNELDDGCGEWYWESDCGDYSIWKKGLGHEVWFLDTFITTMRTLREARTLIYLYRRLNHELERAVGGEFILSVEQYE